jgi:LPS-assembly protein
MGIALAGGAMAQGLVPANFFNAPIKPGAPTSVEADDLSFDGNTNIITASGNVVVSRGGYKVSGDHLVYNRLTSDAHFVGAVTIRDPANNVTETNDLQLTGGMKQALLDALTITSYDGARITADSADYDAALRTILNNATYSPCGECIDDKGRRIGWSMKATRVTQNRVDGSLALEQPSLAVLGIPIAWLPYLWLPDTSQGTVAGVRTPSFDYSEEIGLKVEVPVAVYSTRWTEVILTPTLLTGQGLLMGAEWIQRFDNGSFSVKASGLYQLNPGAFSFSEAQKDWRGALQSSGEFRPIADWKVGWSYTKFTDAAYLDDYRMTTAKSSVNEVYATNLTPDTYIDVRMQQFNRLGDVTEPSQRRQGKALPNARFEHFEELAPGMGRLEISGRLLGVRRDDDVPTRLIGSGSDAVPYNFGYSGEKTHAVFQAGWQNQWIGAGGFVATPYLGGRADVAYYDGTSTQPTAPGETTLWSATPIAAMDVRFPMAASDGSTVHLIEPIGQLVYRGSDTTAVGVTNDDAQSFVFDDTNLFSYNRFSGSDRQETGLRANIGGRYQANFVDGSYLELIGGQSFHLAGANAFASPGQAQTGVGGGLEDETSYAVLGAYGMFSGGLKAGGKVQLDTDEWRVARAGVGATYTYAGYSAMLDYDYIAVNADAGVLKDQHEVGAQVGVPVADYWTVKAGAYWDLSANTWLQISTGLVYDDGFLVVGAMASQNGPTHTSPDDTRFTASFRLKTPAGLNFGLAGSSSN